MRREYSVSGAGEYSHSRGIGGRGANDAMTDDDGVARA